MSLERVKIIDAMHCRAGVYAKCNQIDKGQGQAVFQLHILCLLVMNVIETHNRYVD